MSAKTKLISKNRKALFKHLVLDKYTAGIKLKGYEVKAIREGKVSLEESFIDIKKGIPIIKNLYIGRYSKQGNTKEAVDERRDRELLLNKTEIKKIEKEIAQKGKTAVPLALVFQNGMVKVELAVVKGKKEYEKKQVVKERQIIRDLERETKYLGF